MTYPIKTGPLTEEEILALNESVLDPTYIQPFIQAGVGDGYELFTAMAKIFAALSEAVDESFQELYVLPWSGQTNPPAAGPANATVTLSIQRPQTAPLIALPLILPAGMTVQEQQFDASPTGPVLVPTGRFYALTEPLYFGPGVTGPLDVLCQATVPGAGLNYPLPGTISLIDTYGSHLQNDGATIALTAQQATVLQCVNEPDVLIPGNVGEYLSIFSAPSSTFIARALAYLPPNLSALPPIGGQLVLDIPVVLTFFSMSAGFIVGETVVSAISGASGTLLFFDSQFVWIQADPATPEFQSNDFINGTSGGFLASDNVMQQGRIPPFTGSVAWRVLDWASDFSFTSTNALSPTGGQYGILDERGWENEIPRQPGEADPSYRGRIVRKPDVVSPNAIRRTVNQVLKPYGIVGTLREIGTPLNVGFFYDAPVNPEQGDPTFYFAYDFERTDSSFFTNRFFSVLTDFLHMRAHFDISVPVLPLGDFGFAFDAGAANAYDAYPWAEEFYDGFPVTAATILAQLYAAVNSVRGAGTTFDIYELPPTYW